MLWGILGYGLGDIMNTLIAIILYNKEIENSLTINSLLNSSCQN